MHCCCAEACGAARFFSRFARRYRKRYLKKGFEPSQKQLIEGLDQAGIAEGLAIVAAFRMRLEIERTDDVGGAWSPGHRGFLVFDIR